MIIFGRVGLSFFFCWYSMILSVWTHASCCRRCCWSVVKYSVVSDSLRPHGLQHARLPCPSPTPRVAQTHVHWIGDAIQPSHPLSSPSSQCGWALLNQLKAWVEQKDVEGRIHSLCLIVFKLGHWSPVLELRLELELKPSALLGVLLADGRLWDFSASITMWTNSL